MPDGQRERWTPGRSSRLAPAQAFLLRRTHAKPAQGPCGPQVWHRVSAGPKVLGTGREAAVYARHDGRAMRVLHDPSNRARLEREAVALRALAAAGAPVPAVYELTEHDGRPALVMDRVDGDDFLTLLRRRPWLVFFVAHRLGDLHSQLHDVPAPDSLPDLKEHMRERITTSLRVPARLADFALYRLDALPIGDRVCHGDFQPANVLRGKQGPMVIDWTAATRGDPHADVTRTLLILRAGEVPAGTPRLARVLDPVGRAILGRGYLRSYRSRHPLDPARLRAWEPVSAAERLTHGIDQEVEWLTGLIERAAAGSAAHGRGRSPPAS